MPQFAPSEAKVAIAPITAKPSGMDCEAELFLGPDELTKVASSDRVPFVSTGARQNVRLPIAMPSEGTYHGYIDVFTEGLRFLAYKTKEDVVIKAVPKIIMDLPLVTITDADGIPFADFYFTYASYTYSSLLDLVERKKYEIPFDFGYPCRVHSREIYNRFRNLWPGELTEEMITWDGFDKVFGESWWCKIDFFRGLGRVASMATATLSEPIVMDRLKGITLHGISDVPDLEVRGQCQYVSKTNTSTVQAMGGKRQPDGTINIMFPAPVFHVKYVPGIYHLWFRTFLLQAGHPRPDLDTFIADLGGQIKDAVELR